MPVENTKAPFITFYSFKGGVGRSMALINTAAIMAERGFRVLVIDMDLEAPGLSFLMRDAVMSNANPPATPSPQVGLIDLLTDAKERGAESNLFALSVAQMLDIYTCAYTIRGQEASSQGSVKSSPNEGRLRIMPAGALDEHYTTRFSDLNLRGLYEEGLGEPLIRTLKKKLAESGLVDFVLIDSRTGFSDEAGVCTRDLADYLVILSGLNKQNVEGTSNFLRVLRGATDGNVDFQIILSPVPYGIEELTAERKEVAQAAFNKAWGKGVGLDLEIPYHPRLALTEAPYILWQKTGILADAYLRIEQQVLKGVGVDVQTLLPDLIATIRRKDYSPALQKLRQFVRLDGAKSHLSNLVLKLFLPMQYGNMVDAKAGLSIAQMVSNPNGRELIGLLVEHISYEQGEVGGEVLAQELMASDPELADAAFQRLIANNPKVADMLGNYAVFLIEHRGEPEQAQVFYLRAIEADPKHAIILNNYASFLINHREDPEQAQAFYLRAIEADPKDATNLGNYASFLINHREDPEQAQAFYLRTIEADSKNANNLGNYANLLINYRGDPEQAQAFYLRAIEADPKHANNLGSYASFLINHREDPEQAQAFYLRAIEADPKNAINFGNYGQFLLGNGQFHQGEAQLLAGITHCAPTEPLVLAELCFSLWLATRLQNKAATPWLQGFKFYLQQGFKRTPWNFTRMLAQAEKLLTQEDFTFAQALADAFLDADKLARLDQFEQWRTLEAKPVK
jgi:Tfp pilus assembly protein PilF/cellulose biosynthesis protein BcsQ